MVKDANEATKFYGKLNEVRKEALTLDWIPDKEVKLNGKGSYSYISIYKMKRNLAPLFAKYGIELIPTYHDFKVTPVGPANLFSVQLDMRLVDSETGFSDVYSVYGCAPASDKGPTIAMSYAMKQWLSDQFLLIDGIVDPDDASDNAAPRGFSPKTPEETEMAKSKILEKAVKTSNAKAAEAVKEPAGKKDEPAPADAPAKAPEAPKSGQESQILAGLPKPQANAIEKIISVRTQWAKEGKLTAEEYNQMSSDFVEITDSASAVVFIKKYKVTG